jgi:hypothetical protein
LVQFLQWIQSQAQQNLVGLGQQLIPMNEVWFNPLLKGENIYVKHVGKWGDLVFSMY